MTRRATTTEAPTASDSHQLLSVADVARLTTLSQPQVRAMGHRGDLPGMVRLGSRIAFRRTAIAAYIDAQQVASQPAPRPMPMPVAPRSIGILLKSAPRRRSGGAG